MKRVWIKRLPSFKEAEKSDENYYLGMSGKEKLETMQILREIYYKIKNKLKNEGRKGLRRVIRVIQ